MNTAAGTAGKQRQPTLAQLRAFAAVAEYLHFRDAAASIGTSQPALALQVHEEQTASLVEGLAGGRLDLLLLAVPLGVPGVTELPLFDEDFVLVTPSDHWLAGRGDIPREALRELDLLLLEEGHCL